MRINELINKKIDQTEYKIEIRGEVKIFVDGFEMANDWLPENLLEDIAYLCIEGAEKSIVNNTNPYFHHISQDQVINKIVNSALNTGAFANHTSERVLEKVMKRARIDKEEALHHIRRVRPDFMLDL